MVSGGANTVKTTLNRLKWFFIDLIFPMATPFTEEQAKWEEELATNEQGECDVRAAAVAYDAALVTAYLAQYAALLDEEDERRQSAESRLTSILGLSSIAGTLVFGGILAQASGAVSLQKPLLRDVMAFGALYLALQICSAILAAIRGLEARGYDSAQASDVLPALKAAPLDHFKTQVSTYARRLANHRFQNNEKVTQMMAAHRATKNFFWGLIILALFGTYYALTASPSNDLVHALKTNHELNDLLRGLQGPKGDPGPVGPKGECFARPPAPKPRR
jgi:hypothetical protein